MNLCTRGLHGLTKRLAPSAVLYRTASNFGKTPPLDKYVQVLPIIKVSPSYPTGKILLAKWKFGNYLGRYTGLIEKLPEEIAGSKDARFEPLLQNFAKNLVPSEIRSHVTTVECQGVLKFDGPPDSFEYIVVASVNSPLDIQNHSFSAEYPYDLEWFDINQIPFKKMPADDEFWYPFILQGKQITGSFKFGGLESRTIKSYNVEEVKQLEL